MIIETHAHYDDEQFDEDRDQLLSQFKNNNIDKVVNVGSSLMTSRKTIEMVRKYPFMYGAVGVHPSETGELNEENFKWIESACDEGKIIAVGEIGLDYYWPEPDHEIQKKWFIRQLLLAKEKNLPVIIHSRDAAKDTMDILKSEEARGIKGVIHCYSYALLMAQEYVDMGYYLGVGGVVTFNNAKKLKEVVKEIPLTSLVLETDCPYLAPVPNRGKRNSSLNIPYIINEIAGIKGITAKEVEEVTYENAKILYNF